MQVSFENIGPINDIMDLFKATQKTEEQISIIDKILSMAKKARTEKQANVSSGKELAKIENDINKSRALLIVEAFKLSISEGVQQHLIEKTLYTSEYDFLDVSKLADKDISAYLMDVYNVEEVHSYIIAETFKHSKTTEIQRKLIDIFDMLQEPPSAKTCFALESKVQLFLCMCEEFKPELFDRMKQSIPLLRPDGRKLCEDTLNMVRFFKPNTFVQQYEESKGASKDLFKE